MTNHMLEALQRAQNSPLRRVHDQTGGTPPWPAPSGSLRALVKNGMLASSSRRGRKGHRIDEWHITTAGLDELNKPPKIKHAGTNTLRVAGGSTRFLQFGVWVERYQPEPEAVRTADLDKAWFGDAARRHAIERDRRQAAKRIARAA